MKKTLLLLFSLIMISALFLCVFSVSAATVVQSGSCGPGLTYTLDSNGTLTISGTGNMKNWSSPSYSPWYSNSGSIKKVEILDGATSIGYSSFYYCTSLLSIEIPDSVTSIGNYAFSSCTSLCYVYYTGSEDKWNNIAIGLDNTCLTDATILFNYSDVKIIASGTCGTNITWTLDNDGVLTISGTGKMSDFTGSTVPWADYRSLIKKVVIEDGITRIGHYSFYKCIALTDVEIAEGVTVVGSLSFSGCTALESVNIPESMTTIGGSAFKDCASLESITVPQTVKTIGSSAFTGYTGFTIYGYANTTAQTYAQNNGIKFVDLDGAKLVYGDISGDEEVTVSDVIYMLQLLAGSDDSALSEMQKTAADVTCDGIVDVSDVIRILQYLASPENTVLGPRGMLQFFKQYGEASAEIISEWKELRVLALQESMSQ